LAKCAIELKDFLNVTKALADENRLRMLIPKKGYVAAMIDWKDPLYQKIIEHLPAESGPEDYITSLEVTAIKPSGRCGCGLVPVAINNMTYYCCHSGDSLPGFHRSHERGHAAHKPIQHPTQRGRKVSLGNQGQKIYVTVLFSPPRQDCALGRSRLPQ
jgi:hypothetical protein